MSVDNARSDSDRLLQIDIGLQTRMILFPNEHHNTGLSEPTFPANLISEVLKNAQTIPGHSSG